jgi:hypothetical protein
VAKTSWNRLPKIVASSRIDGNGSIIFLIKVSSSPLFSSLSDIVGNYLSL